MCGMYLDATLQQMDMVDEFTGGLETKLASNPDWTPDGLQEQTVGAAPQQEPLDHPAAGGQAGSSTGAMSASQSGREGRVRELLRHRGALEIELDLVVNELVAAGHYASRAEAGRSKDPGDCQCVLM